MQFANKLSSMVVFRPLPLKACTSTGVIHVYRQVLYMCIDKSYTCASKSVIHVHRQVLYISIEGVIHVHRRVLCMTHTFMTMFPHHGMSAVNTITSLGLFILNNIFYQNYNYTRMLLSTDSSVFILVIYALADPDGEKCNILDVIEYSLMYFFKAFSPVEI